MPRKFKRFDQKEPGGPVSICWENEEGELHRRAYEPTERAEMIADLENPSNGGKPGDAGQLMKSLNWK